MGRKIVLILLVVLVAAFAYINSRPSEFRIERTARVSATSDVVFPLINDLRQWARWSPFEKLDPNMKRTFAGPDSGAGATYSWAGNAQAGEGRMTITDSKPNELVAMRLEFMKPMAATDKATFQLVPDGDGTKVSWIMEGRNGLMGKTFSIFANMDKMVGSSFEGLALDWSRRRPRPATPGVGKAADALDRGAGRSTTLAPCCAGRDAATDERRHAERPGLRSSAPYDDDDDRPLLLPRCAERAAASTSTARRSHVEAGCCRSRGAAP